MYINIIVLLSSCRVRWQHCIPCISVLKLLFGKWGLVEKVAIAAPPVPLAAVQLYSVQTTHLPLSTSHLCICVRSHLDLFWSTSDFKLAFVFVFVLFSCASVCSTLLSSLTISTLDLCFLSWADQVCIWVLRLSNLLLSWYFGCTLASLYFQSYHLYCLFTIIFCNFCLYWNIIMCFVNVFLSNN